MRIQSGKSFISWKGFSQLTCFNFSIFQFLFDFPLSSMDETLFFFFDSVGNYLWKIDIDFSWWEQVKEFSLCVWHWVCVVFLYISSDDERFFSILFSRWPVCLCLVFAVDHSLQSIRRKGEKKIFNYLVQVFHLSLVCF